MLNAVRMPSRGFIENNTYITWKHWEKNFGPTFQVQLLAPWLLINRGSKGMGRGDYGLRRLWVEGITAQGGCGLRGLWVELVDGAMQITVVVHVYESITKLSSPGIRYAVLLNLSLNWAHLRMRYADCCSISWSLKTSLRLMFVVGHQL